MCNKTQQSQIYIFLGLALTDVWTYHTYTEVSTQNSSFFLPLGHTNSYASLVLNLNITSQKPSLKRHIPHLTKSLSRGACHVLWAYD